MRWQDQNRSRIYTAISWLVCAATLPGRRNYDVFLIDGIHVMPVVMKRLFLSRKQKIVAHLGSHTMYFLLSHRFSRPVERLHLWALRSYDALLCEGAMTMEIAHELLRDRCPPTYQIFGGPSAERVKALLKVEPDLESRRLMFLWSGPGEFRMHYKGLDLMIDAVSMAAASDPRLEFDILGDWDDEIVDGLTTGCLRNVENGFASRVKLSGSTTGCGGLRSTCIARAATRFPRPPSKR